MIRPSFRPIRAVVALAVLCGCAEPPELEASPAELPPPAPGTTRVAVRLRGANLGDLVAVLVPLREISAVGEDGRVLVVSQVKHLVDLARLDVNTVVAWVEVPPDVQRVTLRLPFDSWGGYVLPAGGGVLDLRGRPITYEVTREQLVARQKVVVEIDLTRSLRPTGTQAASLLPHSELHF